VLPILILCGCNAFESTIYKKPNVPQLPSGIPYLLPKGHVEISLQVIRSQEGKFKSIDLKSETKLVPDPDQLYVLNSGSGLFSKRDQKITLKDGMLTSIHTEDEGQIDEAIKAIAGTWINIMSIGVLKGTIGDMPALGEIPSIETLNSQSRADRSHTGSGEK